MNHIVFYCEGCPHWEPTHKEHYGDCLVETLVIYDGLCQVKVGAKAKAEVKQHDEIDEPQTMITGVEK